MNKRGKLAAGGCEEPVMVMKAMDAERAAPLANQPGPNNERARTPIVAQPIWATNILYFLADGESGAVKSTAETAPSGAIVNVTPLNAII